jgi:catechol 2,3-dioxygenase-like lactoylglutathione lyase family enzyme
MKTVFACLMTALLCCSAALVLAASAGLLGQAPVAPESAKATPAFKVQFDHATISVADVEAEASWYIRYLGFSASTPPSGGKAPQGGAKRRGARLTIPGFQLNLVQYEGSRHPQTPTKALQQQSIACLAFSVSDLDAAVSSIKAAGIETTPSHNPQGKVVGFMFHDPEGNQLEFFTY